MGSTRSSLSSTEPVYEFSSSFPINDAGDRESTHYEIFEDGSVLTDGRKADLSCHCGRAWCDLHQEDPKSGATLADIIEAVEDGDLGRIFRHDAGCVCRECQGNKADAAYADEVGK